MGIVSVDKMILRHSLFAILSYYDIIEHLVAPIVYNPLDNYSILEINLTKRERISKLFLSILTGCADKNTFLNGTKHE